MDKRIYYLGYYDTVDNKAENRNIVLSCANKMTYIISAIEKAGYGVDVVSASATKNPQKYNGKTVNIGKNSTLTLFKTLPWGNKFRRALSTFYARRQLKNYINKNIGENDTLIVYHSVAYAKMLCKLKKKKRFKLVLEVEEIYADVNHRESDRKKEYALFSLADAFIFPTELLNEKLNKENKPYSIIYGTYHVEPKINHECNDKKTHIVYAGTFMPDKGVLTAINAAKHLDSTYHIHVAGFGTKSEIQLVQQKIKDSNEVNGCKITYEGLLYGEEYIRLVQSCQIGLSPQSNQATFNETSFPSKVLSYFSNGLRVVSIRIRTIETSKVGDMVVFYDEDNGKALADAIMSVDINEPYDSREKIKELDMKFTSDIRNLMGSQDDFIDR